MKDPAKIYIVDDDKLITSMLAKVLKNEGFEVEEETEAFDQVTANIESWSPDAVLLDFLLPGRNGTEILEELKSRNIQTPVIMLTSDDSAETAVKCMKLGAVDYLTKPFNLEEVKIVIQKTIEKESLQHEVKYLRKVYSELFDREMIGESKGMRDLKSKMEKIARARVPGILISGESGTGKELVARCIHRIMSESGRSGSMPFVAVNCTALPENLLETELFGYDKGAFTDARSDKKGIFELAQGGTILLDEIGDMKPNMQSKLLRVLEERTIRRIGGHKEIPVELTVIATTSRDLSEMVQKGDFRIDLFYRLNTFSLFIPPLRERTDDTSGLARYFLAHFAAKYNNKAVPDISPETERALSSYHWPGNVRELRNVMERIVVLESSEKIMPWHLPPEIARPTLGDEQASKYPFTLPETGFSLEELEKDLIRQALEMTQYNKSLAARRLNISYDSLRYQIKKFGLEP